MSQTRAMSPEELAAWHDRRRRGDWGESPSAQGWVDVFGVRPRVAGNLDAEAAQAEAAIAAYAEVRPAAAETIAALRRMAPGLAIGLLRTFRQIVERDAVSPESKPEAWWQR